MQAQRNKVEGQERREEERCELSDLLRVVKEAVTRKKVLSSSLQVLVDAECTHDGSLRHVAKFEQWGWDTLDRRFLDANRLRSLAELQRGLLLSGFRLLRPGGTLVYCTCSFSTAQNEEVVLWLLDGQETADVVALEEAVQWPCAPGNLPAASASSIHNNAVQKMVRFHPSLSQTSGLFVAKLTKREP